MKLKKKPKLKITLFYLILIASFITLLIYDFSQFTSNQLEVNQKILTEEQVEITQKSLKLYVQSLSYNLEKKTNEIHRRLTQIPMSEPIKSHKELNEEKDNLILKGENDFNTDPFLLIGSLKKKENFIPKNKKPRLEFLPHWILSSQKEIKQEFPPWLTKELKKINLRAIWDSKNIKNFFYQIKGPRNYPIVALLKKSNTSSLSLSLLPLSYFSFWNQIFKNNSSKDFYVVNSKGSAFLYPKEAYVGSPLGHYPIVKRIIEKKERRFSGKATNAKNQKSFFSFIQIEDSNLHIVGQAKPILFFKIFTHFFIETLFVKTALFFLAFLLVYLLILKNQKIQWKHLKHRLSQFPLNQKIPPPNFIPSSDLLEAHALLNKIKFQIEEETSNTLKAISLSSKKTKEKELEKNNLFSKKVKNHLFAILAHVQLLESKISKLNHNTKNYKRHLRFIEEEIQLIRKLTVHEEENQKLIVHTEDSQKLTVHKEKSPTIFEKKEEEKSPTIFEEKKLFLKPPQKSNAKDEFKFMALKSK